MEQDVLLKIKGGLIVSCQALEDEPLHSSYIMQRMAVAAMRGGAAGIRANSIADIKEIKKEVSLPIIGIIKRNYPDSQIYITPTMREVDELAGTGAEIISMDSTEMTRPQGLSLKRFFEEVKKKYPKQLFMADCSTYEEGMEAARLGFDIVATTMHGYTPYTADSELPNFELMRRLVMDAGKPVIAEGGIWTPEQLRQALDTGVLAAVVGTAITRPMEITKRYVAAIRK